MKKVIFSLVVAGMAGFAISAIAQPAPEDENTNAPATDQLAPPPDAGAPPDAQMVAPPDAGPGPMPETAVPADTQPREPLVITPSQRQTAPIGEILSGYLPPAQAGTNSNDLNLSFNRAPLDMVLNYLSDAAGFIIIQETRISQNVTVTVNGKHLTKNEAVDLLNSVLNKNGYAAIRDGRTLTIVDKNDAKTRDIPVKSGNNPEDIPKNAEIVTQIIPIRFVEARQLVSDLSSFVSPQATVVANEAGNSIVVTDTQANIHHLLEIIKAVDESAEAETEIRVFRLEHANPTDVATELGNIFPSTSSGGGTQSPIRFGGPGGLAGRFGGLFGGGGTFGGGGRFGGGNAAAGATGSGTNDRIKKATAVTAVADSRIQAVIVTAPKDLMEQIAGIMKDLDVASDRDQNVYVFHMDNGDPQQAAQVLQNMFQTSSSRTTSSSQSSMLQTRIQNNTTQMGSQNNNTGFGGTSGAGGGGNSRGGGGGF